mgnify:CR=1 FL=1
MTKKELALSFKLVNISTDEFAILEDSYTEGENVQMTTNITFGHDIEHRGLGAQLKFQFEQNEKPFLVITATCGFQLDEEAWESLLDEEGKKLVLPEGFASHLAVITVGTIRGILHEKTTNTPFNQFMIPPINLTQMIHGDVEMEFGSGD